MPAPCKDKHKSCNVWAARGDCHVRALYMMKYCKRACNLCRSIGLYQISKLLTSHFSCQLSQILPGYASIFSFKCIIFFQSPRIKIRHALTSTLTAPDWLKKAIVIFFLNSCTRNAHWAVKLVTQVTHSSRLLFLCFSSLFSSRSLGCHATLPFPLGWASRDIPKNSCEGDESSSSPLSSWLGKEVRSEGVKPNLRGSSSGRWLKRGEHLGTNFDFSVVNFEVIVQFLAKKYVIIILQYAILLRSRTFRYFREGKIFLLRNFQQIKL